MKTFNLSRWALEHKTFVIYLMLLVTFAGIFEYHRLGRDEDPPFTIKTMVVKTLWPGATTLETGPSDTGPGPSNLFDAGPQTTLDGGGPDGKTECDRDGR